MKQEFRGSRINIWKQDPTVTDIGIKAIYLPNRVYPGPADQQIEIVGLPAVFPDSRGDFLFDCPVENIIDDIYNIPPVTLCEQQFDAAHTYAIIRKVVTMFERVLGTRLKWSWNKYLVNTEPLRVYPHANPGRNAYYDRGLRALRFEYFYEQGKKPIFTCRSLDIVSHEAGHAVIDAIKPGWNIKESGRISIELAALQESLCDLTTLFLVLSKFDLVEYIVVQTKADLKHKDNILAIWSEQLETIPGVAGARNAINELKLSEAGAQVHRVSEVFTGAVYDILSDIFDLIRDPDIKDDSEVLYLMSQYLLDLVVRSLVISPPEKAGFTDIAKGMIDTAHQQGKNDIAEIMIQNFTSREIITENGEKGYYSRELAELIFSSHDCWNDFNIDLNG